VKNIECPFFFKLDGRWVLIVSQGQPVDWFVGDLDEETMRFTPKTRGKVDYGQVYAPSVLVQGIKRPILWGWINGVPAGKGWRHCLTMPRELSIRDGRLVQAPVDNMTLPVFGPDEDLLGDSEVAVGETRRLPPFDSSTCFLFLEVHLGNATGFEVQVFRAADGTPSLPIGFDRNTQTLKVGGTSAPMPLDKSGALKLGIYFDHTIVEVFQADDPSTDSVSTWLTRVVDYRAGDTRMSLSAEGAPVQAKIVAFPMRFRQKR
jgi:beta-fructofuranosidase